MGAESYAERFGRAKRPPRGARSWSSGASSYQAGIHALGDRGLHAGISRRVLVQAGMKLVPDWSLGEGRS